MQKYKDIYFFRSAGNIYDTCLKKCVIKSLIEFRKTDFISGGNLRKIITCYLDESVINLNIYYISLEGLSDMAFADKLHPSRFVRKLIGSFQEKLQELFYILLLKILEVS